LRLPDSLIGEVETESDAARERLERDVVATSSSSARLSFIADLIGSIDGLPPDLSARKKIPENRRPRIDGF
jgi:hypothetical protein